MSSQTTFDENAVRLYISKVYYKDPKCPVFYSDRQQPCLRTRPDAVASSSDATGIGSHRSMKDQAQTINAKATQNRANVWKTMEDDHAWYTLD